MSIQGYEQELSRFSEFLDVGENATANVHGFPAADLTEMMTNGELDELRRVTSDGGASWYLVGKVKLGRIEFTVFSDSAASVLTDPFKGEEPK